MKAEHAFPPAGQKPVTQRAVLALGANVGDRIEQLQGALRALAGSPGVTVVAVSGVYETDPVGGPEGQPPYLNAVVLIDTVLSPSQLLERAHVIERAFGRDREAEVRFGPRTLDVDIIAYGQLTSDDPVLTLPHPRAHERGFVLVPWCEADPGAQVPGRGPVKELLGGIDVDGVRFRDDLTLRVDA